MGWVLITTLSVLILLTLVGAKRGFISMVVGIISLAASILVAYMFMEPISKYVIEKTDIENSIEKEITGLINDQIEQAKKKAMENSGAKTEEDIDSSAFLKEIDEMSLPDNVKKMIHSAAEKDVAELSKEAIGGIVKSTTETVMKGIAFLVVFIAMLIITSVLRVALKISAHLPVISQLNGLLGAILGLAEAIVVIWVFYAVVTSSISQDWAQEAMSQIATNQYLSMLYKLDPIIKML